MFYTISNDLDYNVIWAYTDGKKIYELNSKLILNKKYIKEI